MIEGLYQVDWSSLRHAHGEAADIPVLILGLIAPDPEEREMALEVLRENIYSQGAVYEATAFSVPFLIQLLQHETVRDKDRLLVFLAHLANGNSPLDLANEAGVQTPDIRETGSMLDIAIARNWARVTRRAVRRGIPVYLASLHDPDPGVRSAAAYLLACFAGESQQIRPVLRRQLGRERDPEALASLVFALGYQAEPSSEVVGQFEAFLDGSYPLLIRVAAGMSLGRILGGQAPDKILTFLTGCLSESSPEVIESYERLPWSDGQYYGDLAMVLCYWGPPCAARIVPGLLKIFDRLEPTQALLVGYALLYLAFGGTTRRPSPYNAPNDLQLSVLECLAENQAFWQSGLDAVDLMAAFKLPGWPEELRAYLG